MMLLMLVDLLLVVDLTPKSMENTLWIVQKKTLCV